MKKYCLFQILISSLIFLLTTHCLLAQSADYHREESPIISWNGVNLNDARSAATAGISVFASPGSAAIANPALMKNTGHIQIAGSYAMTGSTAYQYYTNNTGPFYTADKIYEFNDCFSNISGTFSLGDANIGLGFYKNALLELPDFNILDNGYSSSAVFSGSEDAYFISLSYPISEITLGLKVTYITGNRDAELDELYDSIIRINQTEDYTFNYFILSLGAAWQTSEKLLVSAVFDYSLKSTMDSEIERLFDVLTTNNIEIHSTTSSEDDFFRPSRLTVSALLMPFLDESANSEYEFKIGLEIGHIFWNSYEYMVFGEELDRDFNDSTLVAIGVELPISCRGFDIALRAGYRLDPQPVPEPETTLHWLTVGAGLSVWDITLDVAGSYCFGSLNDWTAQNFSVITTLAIRL